MDVKKAVIKKLYKLVAKEFKKVGGWSDFPHYRFRGVDPEAEAIVWQNFNIDDEEDMFIHILNLQDAGISADFSYLDQLNRKSLRRVFLDSVFRLGEYYFKVSKMFLLLNRANRGSYILEDLIFLNW